MRKALTAFGAGLLIGLGAIALIVALMKSGGRESGRRSDVLP